MTVIDAAILLAGLTIIIFLLINGLDLLEKRAKNTWKTVAQGIYIESAKYLVGSRIATGMTGHYAKLAPTVWDTLVFADGTRIIVINIDELPPPGTYIEVLKNKRAEFKIEIPNIPPSNCM